MELKVRKLNKSRVYYLLALQRIIRFYIFQNNKLRWIMIAEITISVVQQLA